MITYPLTDVTESAQIILSEATVSDVAMCDYCITQEGYEALCDNQVPSTITYSSTKQVISGKCKYELEDKTEEKEHFACLSKFHTSMSKLQTGFKQTNYWKRTRSRLFKAAKQCTDSLVLIAVIVVLVLV